MSRTLHQRPMSIHKRQQVQNRRKAEQSALTELQAEQIRMRHVNRLHSFMTQIPNPWDDYNVSAWKEYHNKAWSRQRSRKLFLQFEEERGGNEISR